MVCNKHHLNQIKCVIIEIRIGKQKRQSSPPTILRAGSFIYVAARFDSWPVSIHKMVDARMCAHVLSSRTSCMYTWWAPSILGESCDCEESSHATNVCHARFRVNIPAAITREVLGFCRKLLHVSFSQSPTSRSIYVINQKIQSSIYYSVGRQ